MEVYQTDNHYIILDGEYSLWCSRKHGTLEPKTGFDLCSAWNPVCIGLVYGVIGKIKIHPDSEWRLLVISKQTCVGKLAGEHDVYQINKIAVLSLSDTEPAEIDLDLCKMHHFGIRQTDRITQNADGQGKSLQKTWNTIRSAAENVKPRKKEIKDREKFERRILEELIKMYNESNSFYYCKTYDLTNSEQRQASASYDKTLELWQRCDTRFFWNLNMMKELTDMMEDCKAQNELVSHWILPVIQGCIDIQQCVLDFTDSCKDLSPVMPKPSKEPVSYTMILISRRSRHRAGTRSKKRGLDETGACANYVETEQIIEFSHHRVSFVQVRGSIPVFWSQTGVKYRPPPKLDKGPAETYEAFKKHLDEQLSLYKSINVITLVELTGKEKVIGDAYIDNVLKYNSQDVTYITFDFHEYCRGMKFENVSVLTAGVKDIIRHMRYCWVDRKGMICEQRGVFRVNCVDCLDRTNVVQTAIARIVMETQCRKLGLLAPDENLPENCRKIFQQLWANTGDAISKQYAGTAALKGDFTRTGERKISGMMKDGVNSANRYYLRFKDTYRQAAIDVTHGKPVSEDILSGRLRVPEDDVREMLEKEENVKQLIEDCKKMLIVEPEECIGGWGLINADPATGDSDRQEMDIILLLSQRAVYVAWYDDEEEQVNEYQRIFLEDIEKLEIGAEHSLIRSKSIVMRLHYRHYADEGFFHTFKAPGTRLFNNLVIPVKTQDEAKEQLRVVCEAFVAAQNLLKLDLCIEERTKLDKKKTKPHPEVTDIHQQLQENSLSQIKLPRDISNTDIPSQPSSATTSPRMRHRLSPQPVARNTTQNQSYSHKGQDQSPGSKRGQQIAPLVNSKAAIVKSWIPAMPKLSKPNGGSVDLSKLNMKSLKSLNLVSKLKTGRDDASRLLSKVPGTGIFYKNNKGADHGLDEPDVFILDDTENAITTQKYRTFQDKRRTFSKDDSSLDESFEVTGADLEKEVVLDSCGILATSAKQILEPPQYTVDELEDETKPEVVVSVSEPDLETDHEEKKKIIFDIGELQADDTSETNQEKEGSVEGTTDEVDGERLSASFKCFREVDEKCPHTTMPESEEVWIKRTDGKREGQENPPTSLDLNLGQKRVIDNSEADKILAKYSKAKQALSHPSMRNSMSDSAIAGSQVTVAFTSVADDSPKSVLEWNFEANTQLQKKLPNLLQSAKMPRKAHRIYENLKQHIEHQLGDQTCHSTIIFI